MRAARSACPATASAATSAVATNAPKKGSGVNATGSMKRFKYARAATYANGQATTFAISTGAEKLAWILAIVFLSWFAWIFYFLLAPISKPGPRYYLRDDRDWRRDRHDYRYR